MRRRVITSMIERFRRARTAAHSRVFAGLAFMGGAMIAMTVSACGSPHKMSPGRCIAMAAMATPACAAYSEARISAEFDAMRATIVGSAGRYLLLGAIDKICIYSDRPRRNEAPTTYVRRSLRIPTRNDADIDCLKSYYSQDDLEIYAKSGDLIARYAIAAMSLPIDSSVCRSAGLEELKAVAQEEKRIYGDGKYSGRRFPDAAYAVGQIANSCKNPFLATEYYKIALDAGNSEAFFLLSEALRESQGALTAPSAGNK